MEHDGVEAVPAGPAVSSSAVTIYDVAEAAGVSPSTVSRALNKPGRINAMTAGKIFAVAERLGYRGNPLARALPTGRTGLIGLIVSSITNPVFFDLIRGAEHAASQVGGSIVLAETDESAPREFETAQRLLPMVDGFVLVASRLDDEQIRGLAARKPLVLANRSLDGIHSIVPNNLSALRAALDHLVELGHRSLAFISGPSDSWISTARWEQLLDEALQRDMTIVEIGPNPPTIDGGYATLQRVLAAGVTAVHAYNDLMALGLLSACRQAGVEVPGLLSIVGNNDIFAANLTVPALTTIRSPLRTIGEHAARVLLAPGDRSSAETDVELITEFVPRDSTGPAPR